MIFDFSPEQKLIAGQTAILFDRIVGTADLRSPDDALGNARSRLGELAGAGVIAMLGDADRGGLGLGTVEALAVMIEAGARLLPLPVAEIMAGAAHMADVGHPAFEAVAAGERFVTTAWTGDLHAEPEDGGLWLTGDLHRVPFAAAADFLVAPFRIGGGRGEVAVIDLRAAGVEIGGDDGFDPTAPGNAVRLRRHKVARPAADGPDAAALLAMRGAILNSGDLCGNARAGLTLTLAHARTRHQFGRAIGANQAVKHIASDAFVAIEHARAAVEYAAWCVDTQAPDAEQAALIAITTAAPAARKVAEDCIQMMGGLGYCWEFDQHLFLKRALRCGEATGSARAHRERLAAMILGGGIAA
jgi:acyl-CoA dehydrogenase